jgi:hypothetical protein
VLVLILVDVEGRSTSRSGDRFDHRIGATGIEARDPNRNSLASGPFVPWPTVVEAIGPDRCHCHSEAIPLLPICG